MKIVHTSDLHLKDQAEERWEALEEIILLVKEQKADLLVISGDLFDRPDQADRLRVRLRSYFRDNSFLTIILPGNHDYPVFREGLYFGEQVKLLVDPQNPVKVGPVKLWGLPFEYLSDDQLAAEIQRIGSCALQSDINILLYHGELLDSYFSGEDLGAELKKRYMPVSLSFFEGLPINYVLSGHFHTRFADWALPGGGHFVYSGSPVSITKREKGQRAINLIDTSSGQPREILLNTFHYEQLNINLEPVGKDDPFLLLEENIKKLHPKAKISLTISGYFDRVSLNMSETEFTSKLKALSANYLAEDPVENHVDISYILNDPLFRRFYDRLQKSDASPELREKALELIFEAFRTVKLCI